MSYYFDSQCPEKYTNFLIGGLSIMLVVTNTIKVKEGHGEAIAQRFGGNNGVQDILRVCTYGGLAWKCQRRCRGIKNLHRMGE